MWNGIFVLFCRENFPCDHQLNVLTKYIIDATQSPNLKVRLLTYVWDIDIWK